MLTYNIQDYTPTNHTLERAAERFHVNPTHFKEWLLERRNVIPATFQGHQNDNRELVVAPDGTTFAVNHDSKSILTTYQGIAPGTAILAKIEAYAEMLHNLNTVKFQILKQYQYQYRDHITNLTSLNIDLELNHVDDFSFDHYETTLNALHNVKKQFAKDTNDIDQQIESYTKLKKSLAKELAELEELNVENHRHARDYFDSNYEEIEAAPELVDESVSAVDLSSIRAALSRPGVLDSIDFAEFERIDDPTITDPTDYHPNFVKNLYEAAQAARYDEDNQTVEEDIPYLYPTYTDEPDPFVEKQQLNLSATEPDEETIWPEAREFDPLPDDSLNLDPKNDPIEFNPSNPFFSQVSNDDWMDFVRFLKREINDPSVDIDDIKTVVKSAPIHSVRGQLKKLQGIGDIRSKKIMNFLNSLTPYATDTDDLPF